MPSPPLRRPTTRPCLRVVGAQKRSIIRGVATPFAEIEAENLSVAPSEGMRVGETVRVARADEDGSFAGKFPMRPNDVVRVRARGPRGIASPWVTFRAKGSPGRPRALHVEVSRLGLRDLGNGKVRILNLSAKRPIAEPGARLLIKNARTADHTLVILGERGRIQGRPTLAGRAGDVLHVETVTVPRRLVGRLETPSPVRPRARCVSELVRPGPYHQKLGFVPKLHRFRAPLFGSAPHALEVFQSELGNCYLASAAASLAHVRPDALARAIVKVDRDTYRVRFRARAGRTGRYRSCDVVVTSDLYVRPSGGLLYGASSPRNEAPRLWWPVLEKAFARLKGSYKKIGRGGCSDVVLERLLGRRARRFFIDPRAPGTADRVWSELKRALDARLPVVAGTAAPCAAGKYRYTGLVADHAYSVLSCRIVRGTPRVGIRNPWGEDVKRPGKARRNGCLEIAIGDFVRLFDVISTVH